MGSNMYLDLVRERAVRYETDDTDQVDQSGEDAEMGESENATDDEPNNEGRREWQNPVSRTVDWLRDEINLCLQREDFNDAAPTCNH